MSTSPSPYTVNVPDEVLEVLGKKLSVATFPDELRAADQWPYGAPLADVKRLAKYWQDGFDWRKAEAAINELPNFRTQIEVKGFSPLDIHFVHQKSESAKAIPLLFCHGCTSPFFRLTVGLSDTLKGPAPLSRSPNCFLF